MFENSPKYLLNKSQGRQVIANKKMLPLSYLSCFRFLASQAAPPPHTVTTTTASVGPLEARAHEDYFLPSVVSRSPVGNKGGYMIYTRFNVAGSYKNTHISTGPQHNRPTAMACWPIIHNWPTTTNQAHNPKQAQLTWAHWSHNLHQLCQCYVCHCHCRHRNTLFHTIFTWLFDYHFRLFVCHSPFPSSAAAGAGGLPPPL